MYTISLLLNQSLYFQGWTLNVNLSLVSLKGDHVTVSRQWKLDAKSLKCTLDCTALYMCTDYNKEHTTLDLEM